MCIKSNQAKQIGKLLPYGSKDTIAEKVNVRKDYVRVIFSGNKGRDLKTNIQLLIVSIAIDMLKEKKQAIEQQLESLNQELSEIENTINTINA